MYCSRCLCSSCGKKIAATRAMDTATADTTAITQFISTATTQFISTATTIVNTPIMTFKALVCTCAGHVWYFPRDVLSSGVKGGVNALLNSPTSRGSVQSLILETIDNPSIRGSAQSFMLETIDNPSIRGSAQSFMLETIDNPSIRGSVQSLMIESIDNPSLRQSVKSFVSETNAVSFYMPVAVLSMAIIALSTTAVALSFWGPKLPPPIQPPPPPTSPPPPQRLQPILIAFPFLIPSASEQGRGS